ncbi:DUF1707 SHOCT-like domain-containing protein [Nocardioides insulae]|uniref:DUF1707 SHOCT-like domain-containing protein n=1 Tax=Nocardioides insulae TaxID=394734 RepID=UPI00040AB6D6|nr:DUF1707 domain-containing protein [Nocardioides insulae]
MSSPSDPSRLRASDADRHHVAERLREAAGEGRIDLEELDQRLERVYRAKTYADLAPLTADLPWQPRPPGSGGQASAGPPPVWSPGMGPAAGPVVGPTGVPGGGVPVPVMHHDKTTSVFSGEARRGVWEIGARHQATSVLASVELDLRQVRFTSRQTEVYCVAFMGTVHIVVNAATHVVMDGVKAAGEFAQQRDEVPPEIGPDSPVVRLTGYAVMGTVDVVRKAMPRPRRWPWGRRRD